MRTIIYDKDVKAISPTNPLPVVGGYNTTDSFTISVTSPDARTAQIIKAATSGKSVYVTDLVISTSAAKWVQIEDTDATVVMYPMYLATNTTKPISFNTPVQLTASKGLNYKASASGVVTISATGFVA